MIKYAEEHNPEGKFGTYLKREARKHAVSLLYSSINDAHTSLSSTKVPNSLLIRANSYYNSQAVGSFTVELKSDICDNLHHAQRTGVTLVRLFNDCAVEIKASKAL